MLFDSMMYVNIHRQYRPSKSFQNATYHYKISSVLISKSSQLCVCFFLSIHNSLLKIGNLSFQNLFFVVMSLNFKIELLLISIFHRFMGITYFMLIFLLIKNFNIHWKNFIIFNFPKFSQIHHLHPSSFQNYVHFCYIFVRHGIQFAMALYLWLCNQPLDHVQVARVHMFTGNFSLSAQQDPINC